MYFTFGLSTNATDRHYRNGTNLVSGVEEGEGASFWPGVLPNTAQIIPPDTRSGMWALNGDLHVLDKVLVPDARAWCRPGDFEFTLGRGFASQVQVLSDGFPTIVPRALPFQFCLRLPCSYEIQGLYGRAGFRLSVEVVVQYKAVLPLCDPWCSPTSWW